MIGIHMFEDSGFGCCIVLFIFQNQLLVPGSIIYEYFLPWFPGGREWGLYFSRRVGGWVVGIHVCETMALDWLRLGKLGVRRGSAVWWAWVGSCLFEGGGCFSRIGWWVKEEREKRKAGKRQ